MVCGCPAFASGLPEGNITSSTCRSHDRSGRATESFDVYLAARPGPQTRRGDRRSYGRMLTARAITSPSTAREPAACRVMTALAQRASGITSVGLNAVALVKPR